MTGLCRYDLKSFVSHSVYSIGKVARTYPSVVEYPSGTERPAFSATMSAFDASNRPDGRPLYAGAKLMMSHNADCDASPFNLFHAPRTESFVIGKSNSVSGAL